MVPLSPEERRFRARVAGLASWQTEVDPTARTAPARAAMRAKFLAEVDPDGVLPEAERQRRADIARRLFYARMSLAAARARRLKQEAAAARANGNGGRKRKPAAPGTTRGQTDHHLDPALDSGSVNQIHPDQEEKQAREQGNTDR